MNFFTEMMTPTLYWSTSVGTLNTLLLFLGKTLSFPRDLGRQGNTGTPHRDMVLATSVPCHHGYSIRRVNIPMCPLGSQ